MLLTRLSLMCGILNEIDIEVKVKFSTNKFSKFKSDKTSDMFFFVFPTSSCNQRHRYVLYSRSNQITKKTNKHVL